MKCGEMRENSHLNMAVFDKLFHSKLYEYYYYSDFLVDNDIEPPFLTIYHYLLYLCDNNKIEIIK